MIPTLKAEVRKLLTVRSTYVLTAVALAFVVFYAGYIEGWHLAGADLRNTGLFTSDVVGALTSLPMVFGAIVAILLMTHEYRYNTIMYTLTASNSRSKVLLSKLLVISGFALLLTAMVGALSPAMSYVGVHLHGHVLVAQNVDYHSLIWRALFNGWAYVTAALLLAVLIRNQIGAIVSLFAVPIAEQVLGLMLKDNAVYLPFSALNATLSKPLHGNISYQRAALVFAIYLAVGWVVAWVLFLKRDATT